MDGSSNDGRCGVGFILSSPKPKHLRIEYALHLGFKVSNNKAEYKALLVCLRLAQKVGVKHLNIFNDSQLVVQQVSQEYQTKGKGMMAYLPKVQDLLLRFKT